jgi:hypothetical protein
VRHAGTVHRKEGRALAGLLTGDDLTPAEADVFTSRAAAMVPVAGALHGRAARRVLTEPVERIAGSHAHLHVNRMLRGAQRVQELVLYDLLDRWYRAALARGR